MAELELIHAGTIVVACAVFILFMIWFIATYYFDHKDDDIDDPFNRSTQL